jgi:hypothetical protein
MQFAGNIIAGGDQMGTEHDIDALANQRQTDANINLRAECSKCRRHCADRLLKRLSMNKSYVSHDQHAHPLEPADRYGGSAHPERARQP